MCCHRRYRPQRGPIEGYGAGPSTTGGGAYRALPGMTAGGAPGGVQNRSIHGEPSLAFWNRARMAWRPAVSVTMVLRTSDGALRLPRTWRSSMNTAADCEWSSEKPYGPAVGASS